ncbi:uncharacterized protein LOC125091110 [Lutra lutra]|uniref:uncharacterized protein LOC125091110 n=1 Tax=Lutra lutra TaxID=9657 RepID=UPI001FD31A59|nr:uncharacterized protein LOC125091110 [Lutra lutra]
MRAGGLIRAQAGSVGERVLCALGVLGDGSSRPSAAPGERQPPCLRTPREPPPPRPLCCCNAGSASVEGGGPAETFYGSVKGLGLLGVQGYPWLTAVTLIHKQNILNDFLAVKERATWGQHVTWSRRTLPRKTGHRPEGDTFQENPSEGSRGPGSGVQSECGQRPVSALVPDRTAACGREDTRERNQQSPLGRPPCPTPATEKEENPGKKGASPSGFTCWKPQVHARIPLPQTPKRARARRCPARPAVGGPSSSSPGAELRAAHRGDPIPVQGDFWPHLCVPRRPPPTCWPPPRVSARLAAMIRHSFTAPPRRGLPSHNTGCSSPGFLPCFLPTRLPGPSVQTEAPQGQRLLFTPNHQSSSASTQQPCSAAKLWKA